MGANPVDGAPVPRARARAHDFGNKFGGGNGDTRGRARARSHDFGKSFGEARRRGEYELEPVLRRQFCTQRKRLKVSF